MGHVLGAEKLIFLIRGRGRPTVYGGRASLILSIPAQKVSLGSPRVATIHVQAPTSHAPPLQSFLVEFSQQVVDARGGGRPSHTGGGQIGRRLIDVVAGLRDGRGGRRVPGDYISPARDPP